MDDKYAYMPIEQPDEYHAMVIRQLEKEIDYLKDRNVELYQQLAHYKKVSNWFIDEYCKCHNVSRDIAIIDSGL